MYSDNFTQMNPTNEIRLSAHYPMLLFNLVSSLASPDPDK